MVDVTPAMVDNAIFGAGLARGKCGVFRQTWLADMFGISRMHVCRWHNGVHKPGPKYAGKIKKLAEYWLDHEALVEKAKRVV